MRTEYWDKYISLNLAIDLNKKNKGNLEKFHISIKEVLDNKDDPLEPNETDLFMALETKARVTIELIKLRGEACDLLSDC